MDEQSKNMKAVFTVVERGPGKSFWVRVGVGFENRDGSWNLRLDAVPTNGKLQVRDWEPYDTREDGARNPAGPGGPTGPGLARGDRGDDGLLPPNVSPPAPRPRPRPQPPALEARDAMPRESLL